MNQGREVVLNWKHLVEAGCSVKFTRIVFDERHNITGTYAHVEHPTKKFEPILFRPTYNCDVQMTARVDDVPHAVPFLDDIGVKFESRPLYR